MDTNRVRMILAEHYSPNWVAKIKSDAQLLAIFKRLQRDGTINV